MLPFLSLLSSGGGGWGVPGELINVSRLSMQTWDKNNSQPQNALEDTTMGKLLFLL